MSIRIYKNRRILAAEGDDLLDEEDSFNETLDNMSEQIDEIQDTVEEVTEDDVDIETDNNIDSHYIAECERCHGVFISAVIENEQNPEKVTGTCPLCGKESDQYLKWVIKAVE